MSCCCACCCGGSGGNGGGLGITSGISALLSLIVITVAITTGEWLLTEERLPKSTSSNASVEPDSKVTYSGLWRVCATLASHVQYECFNIDYFPSEEYSPDPNDSTMAIPYAVTKSTMFFLAATLLLVAAEVCYFAAHVSHPKHRLCVFIAGVVFIVSGLLMLVGMVMYISVFKAEVGSKLRTRSSFQGVYQLEHHMHQQNHVNHQNHGSFLCERHQKRYFFGRDSVDVDFDEFLPPPPSLDYIEYPRQFPRDLTAQTVSTTADVLQEEYSPSAQHEFVTFDLEEPLPPPPPIRECGWGLDTIRRTTPV
ncbi:stargazin related protein STG-1 isoform X2 [Neodiprion pinetum]|uniref:Voltage-dependent calcium channel gamma-5 subunit isoform X2 n=1 Tax=Neodiprion lecontei TaxID=441921 RepID=A0ABM3FFP8_NEOLC|nr:voltage-dependent calcium channel gamma-5 subunit isoform X2 [Neodiprion fabricii]XP_046466749.1 voltage-dependent calcium channel gamma-5 subunit isoform X2 [Neodiprion pinetum]XP_046586838.1 voltage-dependent calcium channel gamma-5 subunit isoform X2 [Neodiprion lecontei]